MHACTGRWKAGAPSVQLIRRPRLAGCGLALCHTYVREQAQLPLPVDTDLKRTLVANSSVAFNHDSDTKLLFFSPPPEKQQWRTTTHNNNNS